MHGARTVDERPPSVLHRRNFEELVDELLGKREGMRPIAAAEELEGGAAERRLSCPVNWSIREWIHGVSNSTKSAVLT